MKESPKDDTGTMRELVDKYEPSAIALRSATYLFTSPDGKEHAVTFTEVVAGKNIYECEPVRKAPEVKTRK